LCSGESGIYAAASNCDELYESVGISILEMRILYFFDFFKRITPKNNIPILNLNYSPNFGE
jgi:hypothetical protein